MKQSDDVKSCFTEDATAYFKGGSYEIDLKNRDEIVTFMAEAFHPNAIAMHQGHHPEIDILSETEAKGLWYLHDIFINLNDNTTLRGSALYTDTYKKVGEEWKIATTSYQRIYEEIEPRSDNIQVLSHYLGGKA